MHNARNETHHIYIKKNYKRNYSVEMGWCIFFRRIHWYGIVNNSESIECYLECYTVNTQKYIYRRNMYERLHRHLSCKESWQIISTLNGIFMGFLFYSILFKVYYVNENFFLVILDKKHLSLGIFDQLKRLVSMFVLVCMNI